MASILFTKLSDEHFEAAEADGYADCIEGYGIDAPTWIPRGSCIGSFGPEFCSQSREDLAVVRRLLDAYRALNPIPQA